MKFIAFILVFTTLLFGQVRWGDQILLGDYFTNSDSTRLTRGSLRTTMTNDDTLYSGALNVNADGIYAVSFYADATSGSPTYTVQARLYYKQAPTGKHWSDWNDIFSSGTTAMTLKTLSYSRDGISWWAEANAIQYRIIQAGTGVATVYLGDYNK